MLPCRFSCRIISSHNSNPTVTILSSVIWEVHLVSVWDSSYPYWEQEELGSIVCFFVAVISMKHILCAVVAHFKLSPSSFLFILTHFYLQVKSSGCIICHIRILECPFLLRLHDGHFSKGKETNIHGSASSSMAVYVGHRQQSEVKAVVASVGSFHSGFWLCKHTLSGTTLDKGWWTDRLFQWMTQCHSAFAK